MALSRRQLNPGRLANESSPIQYVTENGFSIVRISELDGSVIDTMRECRFLVRSEDGCEREIAVNFEEGLVAQVQTQRRVPLLDSSVLWLVCAERRLATYLWEKDAYPAGRQLIISELSVDEFLLATHWKDGRDD